MNREHKPAMQFFEAGVRAQSSLPADRQLPFKDLKEFVERNGLDSKIRGLRNRVSFRSLRIDVLKKASKRR